MRNACKFKNKKENSICENKDFTRQFMEGNY